MKVLIDFTLISRHLISLISFDFPSLTSERTVQVVGFRIFSRRLRFHDMLHVEPFEGNMKLSEPAHALQGNRIDVEVINELSRVGDLCASKDVKT